MSVVLLFLIEHFILSVSLKNPKNVMLHWQHKVYCSAFMQSDTSMEKIGFEEGFFVTQM